MTFDVIDNLLLLDFDGSSTQLFIYQVFTHLPMTLMSFQKKEEDEGTKVEVVADLGVSLMDSVALKMTKKIVQIIRHQDDQVSKFHQPFLIAKVHKG